MKNILIITLGIVALFFLATFATAQTLKAENVEFVMLKSSDFDIAVQGVASVTMPSTKDPKWTIKYYDGSVFVTTVPVFLFYRPKSQVPHPGLAEPE